MTPRPTADERAKKLWKHLVWATDADYAHTIEIISQAILEAEAAVREECAQIAENADSDLIYHCTCHEDARAIAAAIRKGEE